MKLFYQIIVVQLLFNFYVFWRGWQILPDKKIYKIPFAAIFAIELILYLIGFAGGNKLPSEFFHFILTTSLSWVIFIFYMMILLLLFDTGRLVCYLKNKQAKNSTSKRKSLKIRRIYYYCSVFVTVLIMIWGYRAYLNPAVVEKDVVVNKGTPSGVTNLRIVVASDLHIGLINNKEIVQMQVNKIMKQQPDLILIPGDIIDYDLAPLTDQHMDEELKKLKAPYGVYACPGNHEHYADVANKNTWLKKKTRIRLLHDSVVQVAGTFSIIGREDPKVPRKPLAEIIEGVDKNLPLLVLNHRPDNPDEEVDNGIDMAFYGHIHDGQIFPVNYVAKILYELSYGYRKKGNTHLFVSSGLGGVPQYRIGTRSEILVINVRFNS